MIKAAIISPYSGNSERNTKYLLEALTWAVEQGYAPYAPHIYLPLILDDSNEVERSIGMRIGRIFLRCCDEALIFMDLGVSSGMRSDIEESLAYNLDIKHIWLHKES